MRVLLLVSALAAIAASVIYGYSLTLNTSESDSNQNLFQGLAGIALLAAVVLALGPAFSAARRRDRGQG